MLAAGSGPISPSIAMFATLPLTASGHPGNVGQIQDKEGGSNRNPVSCRSPGTGAFPGVRVSIQSARVSGISGKDRLASDALGSGQARRNSWFHI